MQQMVVKMKNFLVAQKNSFYAIEIGMTLVIIPYMSCS